VLGDGTQRLNSLSDPDVICGPLCEISSGIGRRSSSTEGSTGGVGSELNDFREVLGDQGVG
jgi:hypothetical protein